MIIGLFAAIGVSIFYTFSVSSVVPLLKVVFSEHETLVDWMHRVETERRLDVVIADNMPGDARGLRIDHVRPESPSVKLLSEDSRIVGVEGQEPPGSYGVMRLIAQNPTKTLENVVIETDDGERSVVDLKLRSYHWWSSTLQGIARWLPQGKDPDSRLNTLAIVMGALVIVASLGGLCRLINEGLVAKAVQQSMHDLRTRLADHVLHLPLEWHSDHPPGDTLGRFANDLTKVEIGAMTLLGKSIQEPLKALGVLTLTFLIDWRLLVVAIAGVPIGALAIRHFGRAVKRSQKRASQSWGRLLDQLAERIAGIRIVKAYGMQDDESRRFALEGQNLTRAQTRIEVLDAATKPVLETLAVLAVSFFVYYGGTRVFSGAVEPHLFFAAVVCLGGLYDPVRKMGNVNNRLQAADASAKRIYEILDLPTESTRGQEDGPALPPFHDRIEIQDVSFAYPLHPDRPVLRNVSLTVKRGQVVAIVGPNGSGKTTLMSLLLRFYEPTSGRILIDGHDLREVSLASLRSQIGLVAQDSVVFSGTVRENIAYGDGAPSDDETVTRAAQLAHIDDFIQQLAEQHNGSSKSGYDAHITARVLSGGQRQRIALARAILRNPPILVLDEATSQIDSESERRIQEALEDVTRGRTTFIIAHRFSTIARADLTVVLNEGEIVGIGRHAELLQTSPIYVSLCQTQFASNV